MLDETDVVFVPAGQMPRDRDVFGREALFVEVGPKPLQLFEFVGVRVSEPVRVCRGVDSRPSFTFVPLHEELDGMDRVSDGPVRVDLDALESTAKLLGQCDHLGTPYQTPRLPETPGRGSRV